jgi:hypothetical protein
MTTEENNQSIHRFTIDIAIDDKALREATDVHPRLRMLMRSPVDSDVEDWGLDAIIAAVEAEIVDPVECETVGYELIKAPEQETAK